MRFTTILATALSLALGSHGWTTGADGVRRANNNVHKIGNCFYHESCTQEGTQKHNVLGDYCAYWTDNQGHWVKGHCEYWKDAKQCGKTCI
ncbi:hypothetical protein FDECE_3029 [Fusarium decemcellulare]|nr:hypothetical protein FDECE_3029 [Fusarium decemcellulare]